MVDLAAEDWLWFGVQVEGGLSQALRLHFGLDQ